MLLMHIAIVLRERKLHSRRPNFDIVHSTTLTASNKICYVHKTHIIFFQTQYEDKHVTSMLAKRHLLTTLINSLAAVPAPDAPASNPLKLFATSPEIKNIFFTLHVLFPDELLSALDLLDRGMVHRLVLSIPSTDEQPDTHTNSGSTQHQNALNQQSISQYKANEKQKNYFVSSTLSRSSSNPYSHNQAHANRHAYHQSQSQRASHTQPRRSTQPTSIASRLYDDPDPDDENTGLDEAARYHHVRLEAWSCGCPAFVFALFPTTGATAATAATPPAPAHASDTAQERQGGGEWTAQTVDKQGDGTGRAHGQSKAQGRREMASAGEGGASDRHGFGDDSASGEAPSIDRRPTWRAGGRLRGEQVPMCKHLLACLLVERCRNLFGSFVREREVGFEEWVGWEAGWGG
ncbi:Hypothetical protein D9617_5g069200 [Elsinoe fawcettii]|nr:Hypothetical protein D9617_5g069200 [Elsinoe fawcettii]